MELALAWLAAVTTGLESIVIKMTSRSLVRSPWLFNVLWLAFALPLIMALAVAQGGGIPKDWSSLLLLSLSSAGFYVFYTVAIYKIDVSTMSPLFSIRTIFAVLLGMLLLGEKVSVLGIALMAITILASPLASYDEHLQLKAFLHKHVLLAILAMISLAFMGYFTNPSVEHNGYATTILWQDITTLVILLPTLKLVKWKREKIRPKSIMPFIFLGFGSFVYTATTTYAYSRSLSLSSIIVSLPLSMIFAFLLSYHYPDLLEKHPPRVYAIRFSGAAIMVTCAIWLSVL